MSLECLDRRQISALKSQLSKELYNEIFTIFYNYQVECPKSIRLRTPSSTAFLFRRLVTSLCINEKGNDALVGACPARRFSIVRTRSAKRSPSCPSAAPNLPSGRGSSPPRPFRLLRSRVMLPGGFRVMLPGGFRVGVRRKTERKLWKCGGESKT